MTVYCGMGKETTPTRRGSTGPARTVRTTGGVAWSGRALRERIDVPYLYPPFPYLLFSSLPLLPILDADE